MTIPELRKVLEKRREWADEDRARSRKNNLPLSAIYATGQRDECAAILALLDGKKGGRNGS